MAKLVLWNPEEKHVIHDTPKFFTSEKAAHRWLKQDVKRQGFLYRNGQRILLLDISRLAEEGASEVPNDIESHTVRIYELKWAVHDVTGELHKKQFGR